MQELASELMPGQVRLNLKTAKGRKILSETWDGNHRVEFYDKCCNFDDFLKSLKKSHLSYDDTMIFVSHSNNMTIVVRGRFVYTFEGLPHDEDRLSSNFNNISKSNELEGVIISDIPENSGYRMMVLLNGDIDDNWNSDPVLNDIVGEDHPTVSFNCLYQFYDNKDKVVMDKIASGKLRLVAFTKDERVPLTDDELKMLGYATNAQMNKPVGKRKKAKAKAKAKSKTKVKFVPKEPIPKPGFTRISREWHRSGTVILQDTALVQDIMIGQDEDTYFGVQLPYPVDSIAAAYDVLIPEGAKGKLFKRQGEWFMVPVADEDVPKFLECSLMFTSDTNEIYLPLETPDSNKHYIDTVDGRVGKDGKIYVLNCDLSHDQHATVEMKGWCTFYRNTAIRSYSQEGVD